MKNSEVNTYGPKIGISEEIHAMKYRSKGEDFKASQTRVAEALRDGPEHFEAFRNILIQYAFPSSRPSAGSYGRTTTSDPL